MFQSQSLFLAKTFAKYTEQKRIYAKSGDVACPPGLRVRPTRVSKTVIVS